MILEALAHAVDPGVAELQGEILRVLFRAVAYFAIAFACAAGLVVYSVKWAPTEIRRWLWVAAALVMAGAGLLIRAMVWADLNQLANLGSSR